jgi:hypothetical protein
VTPTTTMASNDYSPSLSSKIDGILAKEPSKECIYQLLKLSRPTLTESDLLDDSIRNAAIAALIHEVSAMDRKEANQARLSKVTTFIERCTEKKKPATGKRKANPSSPPSSPLSSLPENFHVRDKWPFLNVDNIHPTHYTINESMEALAATHCIDARGTIAHERQVETPISLTVPVKDFSVEQMFYKHGGGTKHLGSIKEMKEELMVNGPIVSTSFVPRCRHPHAAHPVALITSNSSQEMQPILIIGWGRQGFFEYWLAKRLLHGTTPAQYPLQPLRIGMKMFGVEDECVAPNGDFTQVGWQSGPHFDVVNLPKGWMEYPHLNLRISEDDKNELVVQHGLLEKKPIIVREKDKISRSRRYVYHNMRMSKEDGLWRLALNKVD